MHAPEEQSILNFLTRNGQKPLTEDTYIVAMRMFSDMRCIEFAESLGIKNASEEYMKFKKQELINEIDKDIYQPLKQKP